GGPHRHPVRLDVIRVPVEPVGVVCDEHLRADLADDLDQVSGGLVEVGPPEAAGVLVGRRAHHPRVPVAPGAAEEPVVVYPERGARGGEFADPVAAELVGLGSLELRQLRNVDLPILAERARHQGHVRALGRVPGHGRAGADRLVVRVRVDEHDPPGGKVAHGTTVRTAAAHPFPRHDGKRSRDRAGHVTIGDVKSATGSFPEQSAGTRRFTYGAPRAVTVATDGARVVFLRSAGPYDRVDRLWVYDVA